MEDTSLPRHLTNNRATWSEPESATTQGFAHTASGVSDEELADRVQPATTSDKDQKLFDSAKSYHRGNLKKRVFIDLHSRGFFSDVEHFDRLDTVRDSVWKTLSVHRIQSLPPAVIRELAKRGRRFSDASHQHVNDTYLKAMLLLGESKDSREKADVIGNIEEPTLRRLGKRQNLDIFDQDFFDKLTVPLENWPESLKARARALDSLRRGKNNADVIREEDDHTEAFGDDGLGEAAGDFVEEDVVENDNSSDSGLLRERADQEEVIQDVIQSSEEENEPGILDESEHSDQDDTATTPVIPNLTLGSVHTVPQLAVDPLMAVPSLPRSAPKQVTRTSSLNGQLHTTHVPVLKTAESQHRPYIPRKPTADAPGSSKEPRTVKNNPTKLGSATSMVSADGLWSKFVASLKSLFASWYTMINVR